uniref:Uncharacterized protein n=1 Tax=Accipiter nisus TaxID=211598 RepID=A0A8B9MRV1_9AVES
MSLSLQLLCGDFFSCDHNCPLGCPLASEELKCFSTAFPFLYCTAVFPAEQFFKRGPYRIGGVYWKAKFVEYTDETFPDLIKWLGCLEEIWVIKAEVGDTILVMFVNKASWPFSIQPHGVSYGKAWEGMRYHDGLCPPLFSCNSTLMLVLELHCPYLLCAGEFLRPGRTGCLTG